METVKSYPNFSSTSCTVKFNSESIRLDRNPPFKHFQCGKLHPTISLLPAPLSQCLIASFLYLKSSEPQVDTYRIYVASKLQSVPERRWAAAQTLFHPRPQLVQNLLIELLASKVIDLCFSRTEIFTPPYPSKRVSFQLRKPLLSVILNSDGSYGLGLPMKVESLKAHPWNRNTNFPSTQAENAKFAAETP